MRRRPDQGRPARADRRAEGAAAARNERASVRLLSLAAVAAGTGGAAAAQTPPPPPPRTRPTSTCEPIPDGPGKRVAELQGLDKVTARTQRFYAPVGQATRFGTLEISVGDCLVNMPEAPPESVAYLTIVDNKPGQAGREAVRRLDVRLDAGAVGARPRRLRRPGACPARWRRDPRRPARAESSPGRSIASASRPRNCLARRSRSAPKLLQMLGHELAVEQAEAALDQPRHEMDQRHLRGIALAAEHALAEERRPDRHAVEAADQLARRAGIRRCAHGRARCSSRVEVDDRLVDPGLGMARPRLGAGAHDVGEGRCRRGPRRSPVRKLRASRCGQVEAVERQDAAPPGIEPEELRIVAALAHREDAEA